VINRLEPVFSESLYAVLSKIVYAIELYNLDTLVRPAAALREQQNNFLLNLAEGQPSKRDHLYTLKVCAEEQPQFRRVTYLK